MNKHFGSSFLNFVMGLATVFSLLLAIVMFIILPTTAGSLINSWVELGWTRAFFEGIVRIIIVILYLYLVSLIPDMKRVFQHHGAEHKSVFCYESGKELTPENAKIFKRFHPRCGTSFLFVLIIISIIISTFIPFTDIWVRTIAKIVVAPVVISLGYELLMYSGNHDNKLVKILVAPGLWMQRITTQEPDDTMLEVALVSLQTAMPDIFPDFIPPANANKDESINIRNNM